MPDFQSESIIKPLSKRYSVKNPPEIYGFLWPSSYGLVKTLIPKNIYIGILNTNFKSNSTGNNNIPNKVNILIVATTIKIDNLRVNPLRYSQTFILISIFYYNASAPSIGSSSV